MSRLNTLIGLVLGLEILAVDVTDDEGKGSRIEVANLPVEIDPHECTEKQNFNREQASGLTSALQDAIQKYAYVNGCKLSNATVAYAFATCMNINYALQLEEEHEAAQRN